jgi:hypothetical protein
MAKSLLVIPVAEAHPAIQAFLEACTDTEPLRTDQLSEANALLIEFLSTSNLLIDYLRHLGVTLSMN